MKHVFKHTKHESSGNFGIFTALLLPVVLATAGMAFDLSNANRVRSLLTHSADSAVLAALQQANSDLVMNGAKTVYTAEELLSEDFMLANSDDYMSFTLTEFVVTVEDISNVLTATATYTAELDTTIMHLFNYETITISDTVRAETNAAQSANFYFLIDNTPSMGVAATTDDIALMQDSTPDGCAFACHTENDNDNYLTLAETYGVNIRIDTVRRGVQELLNDISSRQYYPDQFRVGIYSFGETAKTMGLTEIAPPSSDFDAQAAMATQLQLMSIPYQNYNKDQQTHFAATLSDLIPVITGHQASEAERDAIVVLISDGVGDARRPYACTRSVIRATRCIEPIDDAVCTDIKAAGIRLAVLYTTYLPLPSSPFYTRYVAPFQDDIPTQMATCATPGLYAEVGFNDSVPAAISELFDTAIEMPRLTK
ncbi:pilus assembly protein TadG-related protein [Pseudohoeflea coraliihabitans]|uniref:Tad domain-containing protein n=1 Tax=Pseudohoeflea coraliihabitans TaxID=2860393 RepID=A0ABS6WT74_9HYPH|nr:pilus assembly protein TadG-related protein [Pseudohoeflea sp. DP4N28-3]MBW3098622.1 Tad domain-containing protein [Pseudohoeflea sp. DP4N28-3]